MPDHFRLRPRFVLEMRVMVRRESESVTREVPARLLNVSFGGAFVVVDPPFAPLTRIVLSVITATAWEPLLLHGEVRWVRDRSGDMQPGVGVSFDPLSADHALALHRLFDAEGYDLD